MNHLTPEEWMSYLYDESDPTERRRFGAHLSACPECRAKADEWRAARQNLDAWKQPARRRRFAFPRPALRWAAAAAILLAAGFAIGRLASPQADAARIRAAIEPQLRQDLRREFAVMLHDEVAKASAATLAASEERSKAQLANCSADLEQEMSENSDSLYAAVSKLNQQHITDYLLLKRDLDTVALNTDAGLRQAQLQLVQLADNTQIAHRPGTPNN